MSNQYNPINSLPDTGITFTDNTTGDASTTSHGYLAKLGTNPPQVMPRYKNNKWFTWSPNNTTISGAGVSDPSITSPVAAVNSNDASGTGITFGSATNASVAKATYPTLNRVRNTSGTLYWYSKHALTATTAVRAFWGLCSGSPTTGSGTDPLPNLTGIGFYYNSANANWQLVSNNGGASSSITILVNAADTSVHTFEFTLTSAGSMQWFIDGVSQGTSTTQPPATTVDMGPDIELQPSASANKSFNFKALEVIYAP